MQQIIINRYGLNLAQSLAAAIPPRIGYPLAHQIAHWVASEQNSRLVKAVRANQWVVTGEKYTRKELEGAVHSVIQNIARSIFELYHYLKRPITFRDWFVIEPSFEVVLNRPKFAQRGLILAGLHLSGFDLALQWACMNIIDPLVFTLPELGGIHKVEYQYRREKGMNLVHASTTGLRETIRHLKKGGLVVTGIDRPMELDQPRPRFFGRPASLSNHHIFMALKAHVPLRVTVCRLEDDGKYHISVSPPIEMDPMPDRDEELMANTEKVLATAEIYIRQKPQQWTATLPLWPETLDLVPD